MMSNNVYLVYKELIQLDTEELMSGPGNDALLMGRAVRELAHSLCQREEPVRCRAAIHPAHLQDMDRVDGHLIERKICSHRKLEGGLSPLKSTAAITHKGELTKQKKRQP
jgi:hypothetical protein